MKPLFSKELVEIAKTKIMPYSEYIKLGKLKFPDHFYVRGKGKEILFYQVQHSFDPNHIQFKEIPDLIHDFKPEKVFVEMQDYLKPNHPRFERYQKIITTQTAASLIKEFGEPKFVIKTALAYGLSFENIQSPEPPQIEVNHYLSQQGFSNDEVFLYWCLNSISGMYPDQITLTHEQQESICRTWFEMFHFDYSKSTAFDRFTQVFKSVLGKDYVDTDRKSYRSFIIPLPEPDGSFGRLNKLANIKSQFRDESVIEEVSRALENTNRLMIVYGGSHGVVQKPALEYLLHE